VSTIAVGGWVCLLAPLAGGLLITLAGGTISRRTAGYIATLSVFVAFVGAVVAFCAMWAAATADRSELSTAYTWLSGGSFHVGMSILVDQLSIVMMLVVTGVGGLIVAYSVGYMDGDDEERRYFAYMSIFVFAMLMLVEGGNLLLLLVGWGLVGLASYLLIGFWHKRPEAVAAAKKAFVMNAVGDATMALAFFLLIAKTGTLDYAAVFGDLNGLSQTTLNLVALGLLGGAVAKSAQLPLQTWLPDAMEGPTPVSALIHAATMVTAGVYLIVRTSPIFEAAPHIQELAAGLGTATLLLAGLVALVQTDIKRVIAYSTMSQIGYMFLGAGIGAYASAMYLLVAHAFFKALLFMTAGIVIHYLSGEQDMRRMGGLKSVLPKTWIAFLIGSLALVGLPPLAGFWTKDPIIAAALDGNSYDIVLGVLALVGALLTGLYTFRMYFLVWYGEQSETVRHAVEHPHHEDRVVRISLGWPVAVLAVLSCVGGLLAVPSVWEPFATWIDEVAESVITPSSALDWETSVIAVTMGVIGIAIAWAIYRARRLAVPAVPPLRALLEHKFYFDELYDALFYRPAVLLAARLRSDIEEPLVEGSLGEIGKAGQETASAVARAQTGLLRTYAIAVAASAVVLAVVFIAVR
jgi:NADH-quinone oxidoreductase subunit L